MIRWAALGPIPFICFSILSLPSLMTLHNSAVVIALRIILAVPAPMPLTLIKSMKRERSAVVLNPHSWKASSRMAS